MCQTIAAAAEDLVFGAEIVRKALKDHARIVVKSPNNAEVEFIVDVLAVDDCDKLLHPVLIGHIA